MGLDVAAILLALVVLMAIAFPTPIVFPREQFLPDIGRWGYHDARLKPLGLISAEEVAHWTAAIAAEKS
jgi:hypothetical protein